MSDFTAFGELLSRSEYVTALTGAGVSTLSGIPDFRSAAGIYSKPWHDRSVEEILSLSCFRSEPELFYRWAKEFVYCCEKYEPSIIHNALASLEQKGVLHSLFTQNIDLLHTKAGCRNVHELHGSAATHHCLKCRAVYPYAEIAPQVLADRVPHCPKCGGLIKPDIIFYEENLNEELLDLADYQLGKSDLLLILGTSLTVYPVASLPEITWRAGGKLVIVNAQPTRLDQFAAFKFADLKEFGEYLMNFNPNK